MRSFPSMSVGCLLAAACSGSASDAGSEPGGAVSSDAAGSDACGTTTEILPLGGAGEAPGATPNVLDDDGSSYVTFVDCTTGFRTDEVRDADREIVHFDASLSAMVSAASGESVSGWSVDGADLDWSRSGVRFRVRFGSEEGERRAYFTEAGPGTICNLTVAGPDLLFISATSEMPPNP